MTQLADGATGLGPAGAIAWPEPGYEDLSWVWDQMHFPRPATPYSASLDCPAMGAGVTTASRSLGLPLRVVVCNIGGYNYGATDLLDSDFDAWMPQVQTTVMGRLDGLLDRWHDTWLPEVQQLNGRLREFDYAGASTAGLIAQIDESRRIRERAWDIHMQVVVPITLVAGELENVWEAAFGAERGGEALALLQGFPNKTMEAGAALWALSREALAAPAVAKLIAETPVRRIVPLLATTDDGRAFKAKLDAYLEAYGWRSGAFEFADAAWIEDPSMAIATMRDYLKQPDDTDPARRAARAAAERDELFARVSPEIDAAPNGALLRGMLPLAQQYLTIQEDHNFYIDQMNTVLMRLPALEAGRRLAAADAIALPDDVFFLTVDEVGEALEAPSARAWAELIAERRAAWNRQAEAPPPPNLGAPPPLELAVDPRFNGLARFFGEVRVQDESSNVLVGNAACRGTVTARACVVQTLDEAHRLQPGEILVCPMTMPAWTPLFAIAGGVVTDSGGSLSHSAIVAREYGVPCVVGTTSATRRIADGQRITVDGAAGTVTIEPE